MYRPKEAYQMTTAMRLYVPTVQNVHGVEQKTLAPVQGNNGVIMCNFKSRGGTEKTVNGVLQIEDTANVVCWYRPDIKSDCALERLSDGAMFEVIADPENIEMRNMILICKVRRIKGGV